MLKILIYTAMWSIWQPKKNGQISMTLLVDYGDAARFELHALYTQNNGLYVKYAYLYFILDQYICISK